MAGRPHIMILHSGGLRSLVATAVVLHRPDPLRLTLLHIHDGRAAAAQRLEHVRQQADHYTLKDIAELDLASLYESPTAQSPDGLPRATLATARILLGGLAHAMDHCVAELVWPIAVNSDPERAATAQERQLLCHQLADAESENAVWTGKPPAAIKTPLLGYTDQQVVELGAGLGVPWELAWSCVMSDPTQCGACPTCRRRRAAFHAAGVVDPVFAPIRAR